MSREMAQKVIVPQKKIMSQIFLNSGTLVILCLFATMSPQLYSLIQAIIRKMLIFKCLIQAIIRKMQLFKCLIQDPNFVTIAKYIYSDEIR